MTSSLDTEGARLTRSRARSQFGQLLRTSARDLWRTPLTIVSLVVMGVTLLAIYLGMWLAFTVLGPSPVVSVTPSEPQVERSLAAHGIEVLRDADPPANANITLEGGHARITLEADRAPAWNSIRLALREAGYAPDAITVVDAEGGWVLDPLGDNLGLIAKMKMASVAMYGVAVPLVAMRERGYLKLLGTTPLRRSTFLTAHALPRLVILAASLALLIGIAIGQRYLQGPAAWSFVITLILGSAMWLGISLLVASRAKRAENAQMGVATFLPLLLFVSGGIIPIAYLHPALQFVLNCLPTTWIVEASAASLRGTEPFWPLPALWLMMAVFASATLWLAARWFRWDNAMPSARSAPPRTVNESPRTSVRHKENEI